MKKFRLKLSVIELKYFPNDLQVFSKGYLTIQTELMLPRPSYSATEL